MYNNIFLDLDDTILDFKKGQHDALFSACGEFGLEITESDYLVYDRINKTSWKRYERKEVEKSTMLVERFLEFLRYKNATGDAATLNGYYAKYLSMQGSFVPGAEEGVRYLKTKYRLSLITNGNSTTQRGRLKVAGLENFFNNVFISDEVGFRKPDREFFEYALCISGAEKESTLVIGDSPSSDILGANNAGLDAWFFDPRADKFCTYPHKKRLFTWSEICANL